MLKIVNLLLDAVCPPRETELLVRNAISNNSVIQSQPRLNHSSITYLLDYSSPITKALILENKYHHNKNATALLASTVSNWLEKLEEDTVLIPIPLGKKRQRKRGYNQVTEILTKVTGGEINTSLLVRTKETRPQTELERVERTKNVIGAFECPHPELLHNYAGKNLVIVDDVTTTGATLDVARATLAPLLHPTTKLTCLALAH